MHEYDRVTAPVLAVFAETFFATTEEDPAWAEEVRTWEERYVVPARQWSIEKLRRAIPGVEVVTLPGTAHPTLFFVQPDRLANEVQRFFQGTNGQSR